MNKNLQTRGRAILLVSLILILTIISSRTRADTGICVGVPITLPFTDVPATNPFFCTIASAFFSGLMNGTSATTFSPIDNVTREQMAAFLSRTLEQSLKRGSTRAALQRFWLPQEIGLAFNCHGDSFRLLASNGTHVWAADPTGDKVVRFNLNNSAQLATFTNATQAFGVLALDEHIYVTGKTTPGRLFRINPDSLTNGIVVEVADDLGGNPEGITFDGRFIWTANTSGSISRYHIATGVVSTFKNGFISPRGILFDGTHLWVTDSGDNSLKRVGIPAGAVIQTIPVGSSPRYLAFDGANLWVPNFGSDSITVVRASTSQVLATLTGNGLDGPLSIAFDGERIAVANNQVTNAGKISFWNAADFTPSGSMQTAHQSFGVCSDGTRFFASDTTGCVSRF